MTKFSVYLLPDDGTFPNSTLPLLVYFRALTQKLSAEAIQRHFALNQWRNGWIDGIYSYHHYHSITHEVLGIVKGSAGVLFGGDAGVLVPLQESDVVIIPAGVAHKCLQSSDDFLCVGAYPDGREYDLEYGKPGERPQADNNIAKVPLPDLDPLYGTEGKIHKYWKHV